MFDDDEKTVMRTVRLHYTTQHNTACEPTKCSTILAVWSQLLAAPEIFIWGGGCSSGGLGSRSETSVRVWGHPEAQTVCSYFYTF